MESATVLAERFMSQYEDRLSLARISDEILAVLAEGGVRIGDPVPDDLASEARQRLELAAVRSLRGNASAGRSERRHPARVTPAPDARRCWSHDADTFRAAVVVLDPAGRHGPERLQLGQAGGVLVGGLPSSPRSTTSRTSSSGENGLVAAPEQPRRR